jgi:hypothetical protein
LNRADRLHHRRLLHDWDGRRLDHRGGNASRERRRR